MNFSEWSAGFQNVLGAFLSIKKGTAVKVTECHAHGQQQPRPVRWTGS